MRYNEKVENENAKPTSAVRTIRNKNKTQNYKNSGVWWLSTPYAKTPLNAFLTRPSHTSHGRRF